MSFVFVALTFLTACILTVFIETRMWETGGLPKKVKTSILTSQVTYQSHAEINLTIIIDKNRTGNPFVRRL